MCFTAFLSATTSYLLTDVFALDFGYKDYKVVEMSAAAFFLYTFYTSEMGMG